MFQFFFIWEIRFVFSSEKLFVDAAKRIRAETMATQLKGDFDYSFMKSRWRAFTMKKRQIPECYYTHRSDGVSMRLSAC